MSLVVALQEVVADDGVHKIFDQQHMIEDLDGELKKGICLALSVLFLERNYLNWLRKEQKALGEDEPFFDDLIQNLLFVDSYESDDFKGFLTAISYDRVEKVAIRIQQAHIKRIDLINKLGNKHKTRWPLLDDSDDEGHLYVWLRESFERVNTPASYNELPNPHGSTWRPPMKPDNAKFPLKPSKARSTEFRSTALNAFDTLVDDLAQGGDPAYVIFTTERHAMAIYLAGTTTARKKYKFFDPNGGIAVVGSAQRLKDVIKGYMATEEFVNAYLDKSTKMNLFPFESSVQ